MISGNVTRIGRAVVRLPIEGPAGRSQLVDAAVDTGFNGFLALPFQVIASLRLPFKGFRKTTLANGSPASVRAFAATIEWHGQRQEVAAVEVRQGALIGMSLLRGSRLTVDVVVNGRVCIEPLA